MRAAKKLTADRKILQELIPLNALSTERFREVSEKLVIEEVLAGHYLFRKGDRDNQSIYLLEGKVNLLDGFRKVAGEVEAGSDTSRYPISNQQPRTLSARAAKKVVIAKIDSSLLDVFLTWDQSSTAEVVEIGAETNKDWMTRLLQTEAFVNIPPSMIQSLLIKMESLEVAAGEKVVCQGDGGDYFYCIHEGRCAVTRRESPDGEDQWLAELGEGDSFGEDALVSEVTRNATVTMLTRGLLMRLAKDDFVELLKNQLVKRVDFEQAAAMVDDGAVWVDVRTEDEYEKGALEDSVNIPLSCLRDELSELVFNSQYILCCDNGRRSESACFLLSHKGFDVYLLEGGIPDPLENAGEPEVTESVTDSIDTLAEAIDYEGGEHEFDVQSGTDGSAVADGYDAPGEPGPAVDVLNRQQAEKEFDERLQQQSALSDSYKEELDQLKHAFGEVSAKLDEKSVQVSDLEAGNSALSGQLEGMQAALEEGRQQQLALESTAQQQQLDSEQRIKLLQETLDQQQQQLSEALAGQAEAADSQQALQRDNEILRTELHDSSVQLDEQREQLENLRTEHQDSDDAAQRQQSEWEAEREGLQQALDREQQAVAGLRDELSLAALQSSEDKTALEAELTAQLDKSSEKIEGLEAHLAALEQDRSRQEEELQAVMAEREQLQQQQTDSEARKQQLESEIESLRQGAESLESASNEQQQQLQAQLQAALEKASAVEALSEEKDGQVSSLQEQLAQRGTEHEALRQESELLHQQISDLRVQLDQQEDRARELEEENKSSAQKAHEDLTRKNDNEKELQGQIDRLRKKVEQQATDQQKTREEAREDVDNMRDLLHAERQERAEERSEMAARQRELKEQFALIATEHEANLTNHNGAIEEARYAARQEEQERVRELLAEHVETEDQVNRLRQELSKAHEEIAGLARQEKDRRKVDIDLMEEKNQQAVETISQLESQLRQYAVERDAALEEQQSLREKMDALRGEVEVARGLMGEGEQVEDPAKLRDELNESKKNMEIALRLRAEAEAHSEQLMQERDEIKQQLESGEVPDEPLHVPSLDEGDAITGHPGPGQEDRRFLLADTPLEPDSELPPLVDGKRDDRQRRWLGSAIGLCAVAGCVLAGWLLIGVDVPEFSNNAAQEIPAAAEPEAESLPAVPDETPVVDEQQPEPPVEDEIEAVAVTVEVVPTKPEAEPESVTEPISIAAEAQAQSQPDEAVPVETVPVEQPAPVVAGRTYRDRLQIGGQGPVLVELPAGSYKMGRIGHSLSFDEGPQHQVDLPAFSVSKFEVTFAEYDRFARATGRRLPSDESWGRGDRPVINVSWGDARAYTHWLSQQTGKKYRLPSEAEWEYATRAGTTANYWWHDDSDNLHANCFNCGSDWDGARTAPAGSFPANDFGLHDVTGNVQEWTADCYHRSYRGAPADGSAWQSPECVMRVVRGGAYTSPLDSLRSAKRSKYDQDARLDNLGFRVVREH